MAAASVSQSREITVATAPHPVTAEGATVRTMAIAPAGTQLRELVAEASLRDEWGLGDDYEVMLNGEIVPAGQWARPVSGGDLVEIRAAPRGPFSLGDILQIAVLGAALFLPGAIGLTGIAASLASAGIVLLGGLLLSSLLPTPDTDTLSTARAYSLAGGSNRIRSYDALPLVLGEHRIFPDVAARGYAQYEDGEQLYSEIYHLGFGTLAVSDYRIGQNPFSSYEGVSSELLAGGRPDLVHGNVATHTGADLVDTDAVTRQTGVGAEEIELDFEATLFRTTKKGKVRSRSETIEIVIQRVGQPDIRSQLPLSGSSLTPVRKTWRATLPLAGNWDVAVRRLGARPDSATDRADVSWQSLKAFRGDTGTYDGENRLAVRVQASGQLAGRLSTVSALVKQLVPIWDGAAWGANPTATTNPAAILRWYARGVRVGAMVVAGIGLDPARIDNDNLGDWYEHCETEGFRCSAVLQGGWTHERVLTMIAATGMATVSWATGKLGVVIDRPALPSTMITPGNVIAGTMQVVWSPEGADEVVGRYVEPNKDWQAVSLRAPRPGLDRPVAKSVTIDLTGVTSRSHGAKITARRAAAQTYHRRRLIWNMGREGRSLRRGRGVWISGAIVDGGEAGRCRALAADRVTLDRDIHVAAGDTILLRLADGTLHSAAASRSAGVAGDVVELGTHLPAAALAHQPIDVLWRLYDAASPPVHAKIVDQAPVGPRQWKFTAVDETPEYYTYAPIPDVEPEPELFVPTLRSAQIEAIRESATSTQYTVSWTFEIDPDVAASIISQRFYLGSLDTPEYAAFTNAVTRQGVQLLQGFNHNPLRFGLAVRYEDAAGVRRWTDIAYKTLRGGPDIGDKFWPALPTLTDAAIYSHQLIFVNTRYRFAWSWRVDPESPITVTSQRYYFGWHSDPTALPSFVAQTAADNRGGTTSLSGAPFEAPPELRPAFLLFGLEVQYEDAAGDRHWTPAQVRQIASIANRVRLVPSDLNLPANPTDLRVHVDEAGWRIFKWSGDTALEYEIRIARSEDATWGEMDTLAEFGEIPAGSVGHISARPPPGTWTFEIRGIDGSGTITTGARVTETIGLAPETTPASDLDLRAVTVLDRGKRAADKPQESPADGDTYYELRYVCPSSVVTLDAENLTVYLDHVYRRWRYNGTAGEFEVDIEEATFRHSGGGWVAPPAALKSVTLNGLALVATYDIALNPMSTPALAAFSVRVGVRAFGLDAMAGVVIADNAVTLTLAAAPDAGDAVLLSYDPTLAVDRLEDVNGHYPAGLDRAFVRVLTPVALEGATVSDTSLVLDYDAVLDWRFVPALAAFSVTVDGAAAALDALVGVVIADNTVTLTLAAAPAAGAAVLLSYDPTAAVDELRALSGTHVPALADAAVTVESA